MWYQIWRHIKQKPDGTGTGADILAELRDGSGLLAVRLQFDALGPASIGRAGSVNSLGSRSTFGSPSRFSISRRSAADD